MFSERSTFFLCSLLDDCFFSTQIGLLLQSAVFQLCKYSYRILNDKSKPVKYDFQIHADENKTITLTEICEACALDAPVRERAIHYCEICLGEIHTNIICYVLHERLVNGWGKIWCVTLY